MAGIPKGVALAGIALLAASGLMLFLGVDLALGLEVMAREVIPGSPAVSVKGGALLISTSLITAIVAYGVLSGSRWGRPSGAAAMLSLSAYLLLVRRIWDWTVPAAGVFALLAIYLASSREAALFFRGEEWRGEVIIPSPSVLRNEGASEIESGEVVVEGIEFHQE